MSCKSTGIGAEPVVSRQLREAKREANQPTDGREGRKS